MCFTNSKLVNSIYFICTPINMSIHVIMLCYVKIYVISGVN